MSTHVTTQNLVRADVPNDSTTGPATNDATAGGTTRRTSRSWAIAGIGAGLAGIGTIVTSGMVNAVYDPDLVGDPAAIQAKLADQTGTMYAFHTFTAVGAVLLFVFAAGLHRRLRDVLPHSIAPTLALTGLVGTGVVSILGSGLDTEFMMGLTQDDVIQPQNAAMYNHWIGTIPWLWTLAGLAGLALFSAFRQGGLPRWIGVTGLVLGGITVLLGVSPVQYMAGMTGPLLVLGCAIGFTVGDRKHRAA